MPNRLTGANYRDFLENNLPVLLEEVPLAVRAKIWFQHDGAPAHFSLAARQQLTTTLGDRWIGHHGPVPSHGQQDRQILIRLISFCGDI